MAWIKAIENDFGGEFTYWEVEKVMFDALKAQVTVSYLGWISQEAKEAGKLAISDSFSFPAGEAPQLSSAVLSYLETRVRSLDKFQGAQDV